MNDPRLEAVMMMEYYIGMRKQAMASEDWNAYYIYKREWDKWFTIWQVLFYEA